MTKFDRNHLMYCTIKNRYLLTKDGSSKQTWHITLDIAKCKLDFEPGDSIGIFAQNDPILVSQLIEAIGHSPLSTVSVKKTKEILSLEEFFTKRANLSQLTSKFLTLFSNYEKCEKISSLLSNKEKLKAYLIKTDPLEFLQNYRQSSVPLQDLVDKFSPLLPRYYSIASCQKSHPSVLDLTVALSTWVQNGKKRFGVASHFLCSLAKIKETKIPFFIHSTPHFRLPENPLTNIIMIGPGTGIAPFRAFLQKRSLIPSQGRHWLFFGERNRKSDYLYEEEFSTFKNLRISSAFSRDQKDSVYVQHKIRDHGKEVNRWIEEGAYLYICGDAKQMAKDVERSLIEVIQNERATEFSNAVDIIKQLRKQKRILLDVY